MSEPRLARGSGVMG